MEIVNKIVNEILKQDTIESNEAYGYLNKPNFDPTDPAGTRAAISESDWKSFDARVSAAEEEYLQSSRMEEETIKKYYIEKNRKELSKIPMNELTWENVDRLFEIQQFDKEHYFEKASEKDYDSNGGTGVNTPNTYDGSDEMTANPDITSEELNPEETMNAISETMLKILDARPDLSPQLTQVAKLIGRLNRKN